MKQIAIESTSDDEVLWQIESASGVAPGSFPIGTTPPGFREVVALREELLPGQKYVVIARVEELANPLVNEFDPGKLDAANWDIGGSRKTASDADLDDLKQCR